MRRAERPVLYRWTRHEYERLIEHGFLDEDDPVELLDGLLLVKEPQHSRHRTAVVLVVAVLERVFRDGWFVQTQSPIALGPRSEPEPDVAVIRGRPRDYVDAHPTNAALVVGVAKSGLHAARGRKAIEYARAGIADYWIVNLVDGVLEVHREPVRPGPARPHWVRVDPDVRRRGAGLAAGAAVRGGPRRRPPSVGRPAAFHRKMAQCSTSSGHPPPPPVS
jgi:Uma2 family endonuclease